MAELDTSNLILLSETDVVPLDATWVLPGSDTPLASGYLQGAGVFDVAALKAATPLGSRYPDASTIAAQANALGISKDSPLLIYDRAGFFSAPFIQWSFQSCGHAETQVIEGGLPFLKSRGIETVNTPHSPPASTGYTPTAPLCRGVIMSELVAAFGTQIQIVDARSQGRFHGTEPEPREGLRSGHMPGAINLPLGNLLAANKRLHTDIEQRIESAGIDLSHPIITTCGSGVTACALRYIFEKLGADNVCVYMGSWAEYGASDAPIEI